MTTTNFLRQLPITAILLLAFLVGCTQNPQDLKEKTARATAEAKQDARAVAAGIREGWRRDKPLDLNSASKEQLVTLPGLTTREADRVIAGRPYSEPDQLVTRGIMTKTEYDKIADRIVAKR